MNYCNRQIDNALLQWRNDTAINLWCFVAHVKWKNFGYPENRAKCKVCGCLFLYFISYKKSLW